MKKIIFLLIIILSFSIDFLHAQDIHFSQPEYSPINLNPALTGKFNGDYRVALNNRNQWRSVTVPYKTTSFAFDANLSELIKNAGVAAGVLINSDKAGDAEFGMLQIGIPIAFSVKFTKSKKIDMYVGAMPSYTQKSINYAKLRFNSQYSGGMYNPDIAPGEVFSGDNLSYFDLSAGINFAFHYTDKLAVLAGSSVSNITEPNMSLFDDNNIKLDRRYTFYSMIEIKAGEKYEITPGFIQMQQGKFRENNIGGNFKMYTGQKNITSIFAGGWYRFGDAFVAKGGFEFRDLLVGISYDINSSKLTTASRGLGGFELALVYLFHKKDIVAPVRPCPDFL